MASKENRAESIGCHSQSKQTSEDPGTDLTKTREKTVKKASSFSYFLKASISSKQLGAVPAKSLTCFVALKRRII
jgi:hypothetical protein